MSDLSVLYDAPGPRARARNTLYTVVFLGLLALGAWWVWGVLSDKGQLEWDLWKPFFTDSDIWTTFLLPGLWDTLVAAFLAMVIALPLGAVLGIGRLSEHRWIRLPAGVVVEFFRAIPVLVLMLFANEAYAMWTDLDPASRPMYAMVTGLVLYNASVLAEVVRAGVLALPRGQSDAAMAIGMRRSQTMVSVLLPQAVTAMLPAIVSQLVVILKDTALGGAMLSTTELLGTVSLISANYANLIAAVTVVALIYILVNFLLTSFASWLEGRIRRGKRSTGTVLVAGVGDALDAERPGQGVVAVGGGAVGVGAQDEDKEDRAG
ncbi:amino acid ABC transporter permease [Streptomyces sp. 4N509B]|uniref:amino acid ABC transporter permease n=1 Tax=Streptomyces sp. 4N509B TaxID=3457413 RepID=UPI003FD3240B